MALTWASGQRMTPARLNRRLPVTATKSGNENRANTASPANDSSLVLALKASTTYDLTGVLIVSSAANAAGDFFYQWAWTGSATVYHGSLGAGTALASGTAGDAEFGTAVADSATPGGGGVYGASTSNGGVRLEDRIVVGASDITLTLQWAQQASNANNTTLLAGSWITATPVA